MPITILIVENEQNIRKMLRVALKGSEDTDFLEATDGTEALKIAREHRGHIDLLLSEVVMPGSMSGIEMAAQLSQARPKMKVVLMSGYDSEALRMEPDWHFIQKPFSVSEIQERIGNILGEDYLAAKSHNIPKAAIWIRAGGKCECTSACEHHRAGRCGIALFPNLWSTRDILPAWIGAHKGGLMLEALCEACRLNPAMQDEPSDDFKRANPNWWYRRQKAVNPQNRDNSVEPCERSAIR